MQAQEAIRKVKESPFQVVMLGAVVMLLGWSARWIWETNATIEKMEVTMQAQWETIRRMDDSTRRMEIEIASMNKFQTLMLVPAMLKSDIDFDVLKELGKHIELDNNLSNQPPPIQEYIDEKEYQTQHQMPSGGK